MAIWTMSARCSINTAQYICFHSYIIPIKPQYHRVYFKLNLAVYFTKVNNTI